MIFVASSDRYKVSYGEHGLAIHRAGQDQALLVQHAEADRRPYIHPIVAPDGAAILTEDSPPHHPWQHGLYVGLNDVNGVGFWEEGRREKKSDGTFHPRAMEPPTVDATEVSWKVITDWRGSDGSHLLTEEQAWTFRDRDETYSIDLAWSLTARVDLTFGQHAYGGLFLRMPYRPELGGGAVNSEGLTNRDAERQRARWVAVSMPIVDEHRWDGIAIMDHPENREHPVPWRIDSQLGIAPSCCIAGPWRLMNGQTQLFKHRLLVFCGQTDASAVETAWGQFAQV